MKVQALTVVNLRDFFMNDMAYSQFCGSELIRNYLGNPSYDDYTEYKVDHYLVDIDHLVHYFADQSLAAYSQDVRDGRERILDLARNLSAPLYVSL